ncbi:MAG: DMT family transporter [Xanthomonadales bacterium]|nr:DMT family transporter [Gammaproteobacteria bacterium]MBT8072972.1 DMT family transporter [Gammaproteobacteria bacterium]NNK03814.1 DMT family transporter [Xanthomonadales bacterium]NNK97646.1 DMT family transporter [Xanthomonadales bacterium]
MPTSKPTQAHREHVALGMSAALGAFLMFTVMNMFAKVLSDNHSVIEIAFYRNLIACLPFLISIFAFGRREILVIHSKPSLVGIRAVIGTISLVTTFAAYSLMPMADTTALLFTASLFIPVLGVIFLRESVGPWRWSAIALGFIGVIIMSHPSGEVNTLGIMVALFAAVLHATLQIILRYLSRYESPETISFYFFVIGVFLTALPLPFIAVRPTLAEIPLLVGVGLSGAAAQWLLSIAFRNAKAAVVTVFNYSSIVWAALFGWMIWNEWPMPTVIAGAIIVIASNILVIWRESRLGRISDARFRAKL